MKSRVFTKGISLLAILIIGLYGCSAGGGDNMGQLSLSLTDKPSRDFSEVWVTIQDIYVHMEGDMEDSWTKILDVNKTINLRTLSGGIREELGIVELTPGHYTQMRLMIGTVNSIDPAKFANYVLVDNEPVELKIPSGVQSGVKLVQGFDINESDTTRLIFDFDIAASIVAAGNSGKYILRPTIHQIDDSQTRTNIKGFVKDGAGVAIPNAHVSLQVFTAITRTNPQVPDIKDEVVEEYQTYTDSAGAYLFWFLNLPEPKTFNIVATNWDTPDPLYGFDWDQILNAVNGNAYPVELTLPKPTEFGVLDITAIVVDNDTDKIADETHFVTLSVRKLSDLPGAPMVEVLKQVIVGYDDDWVPLDVQNKAFHIDLPIGTYTVVAIFDGRTSLELTKDISVAGPNKLDFSFPVPPTP